MIDFHNIQLEKLIIHYVGNKLRGEGLKLSKEASFIEHDTLQFVLKYFISPFKIEDFECFFHSINLTYNEIYQICKQIFADPESLSVHSQSIATLLYENSTHPNIKAGEVYVCLFKNCFIEDAYVDAIGIFKSENKEVYLKVSANENGLNVYHDRGININKLDKGCLIFNLDQSNGYKVLTVDNLNKSSAAQYWKESFLLLRAADSSFRATSTLLNLTKDFVTNQLKAELEIPKSEQIEMLNKSAAYFQNNNQFNKDEFESEVFKRKNIIESFRKFESNHHKEDKTEYENSFEISASAVKKQVKYFKRVIKLDRNFDIHIHGNHELIERGYDSDSGRKFYKIYFDKEA